MSVNKVTLLGRVIKTPEIKVFESGSIALFTLVTDYPYNDPHTGERKKKTEFHKIVVKSSAVSFVQNYVQKGTILYCEGQLNSKKWNDDKGHTQYGYEIVINAYGVIDIVANGISNHDTNKFKNQVN